MLHAQPLTVLVVDDELPLREELRLFPWHDSFAELVGEAENGEEALQLCRKLRPDVVITDITMPVMDGMDLFRRIREEFPLTQVVLLTCHSDFAYAKEALKLGALEYLIKVSLLDSELQQALDKARDAIQREHNHRRNEMDRYRWELTRLLSLYGKEQNREVLLSSISATVRSWDITWPMRIARMHVNVSPQEEMFVHRELQALLCEWEISHTKDSSYRRWIAIGPSDYLLIHPTEVVPAQQIHTKRQLTKTKQWLEQLQSALEARTSYLSEIANLYMVLGPDVHSVGELPSAMECTKLPAAALFYDAGGSVYEITADERPERMQGSLTTLNAAMEEDLAKLAGLLRQAASDKTSLVQFYLEPLSEWASRVRPEPAVLKKWMISLQKVWIGDRDRILQTEAVQKLQSSRTLAEFVSVLIREVESRAGSDPKKYRKEVAQAVRLITKHIAEPITLTWAAEQVGLSSFYLSRLFREEVGESFNEYVTRQRIDKAIVLLQTTNLKVYEVAEQIGIPSYRYFSVLFRNRTGVSPTEYKKGGAEG